MTFKFSGKVIMLIVFFVFNHSLTYSQDLENLKDQKPFKITGGISLGTSFFHSNQEFKSRDPFAWNLNAYINPSFYGFSLPFSFFVTQYSQSYRAPFTQMGISPTYKWATLHLGYRHISLSPLVFEGSSFLGAGIELKPKRFQFAAFYGRLNKAITEDTTYDRRMQPQYSRVGYGLKIGIGAPSQNFSLQFFHAKDDPNSIVHSIDTTSTYSPQENSVLGSSWRFLFFKRFSFTGDFAVSLLSQDIRYADIDAIEDFKMPSYLSSVVPLNYSSVLSFSGQAMLGLTLKGFNMNVGYKRVEPDFQSLGVPYAINDIEMFSSSVSTSLLKNKISINASGYTQENNLAKNRASTVQSMMGNLNVNAFVSQKFNVNMNLTGVNVYQKDGFLTLSDSTRMNQMMTAFSLSPTYNAGNELYQNTIGANLGYTNLNDKNLATKNYTNGNNINTSLNYNLFMNKYYAGIFAMVNYSLYKQSSSSYQSVGFNVGGNAQFLKEKNLTANGSMGYFINRASDSPTGNNTTFSLNISYALKKHSIGIFSNYIITPPVNLNPLNEIYKVPYAVNSKNFSGGINYSYRF